MRVTMCGPKLRQHIQQQYAIAVHSEAIEPRIEFRFDDLSGLPESITDPILYLRKRSVCLKKES